MKHALALASVISASTAVFFFWPAVASESRRTFAIREPSNLARALEELRANPGAMIGKEVTLYFGTSSITGEIVAQTGTLLQLKSVSGSRIMEGQDQGRATAQITVLSIPSIVGFSFKGLAAER